MIRAKPTQTKSRKGKKRVSQSNAGFIFGWALLFPHQGCSFIPFTFVVDVRVGRTRNSRADVDADDGMGIQLAWVNVTLRMGNNTK